nr:MAG TPA: hypothetical protein [Caudoviricetes sp.]
MNKKLCAFLCNIFIQSFLIILHIQKKYDTIYTI